MHRIINDIQIIIENAMKENLPEVSSDVLEENGKVYYMNGKNGTEFDWFVNNHLPTFMVFYNDEKNLESALDKLKGSYEYSDNAPEAQKLIKEVIR